MLKITKGLNVGGITTYTDDKGNRYVRVKMDGEDFCISLYDYTRGGERRFSWDDAMKATKAKGLTMLTRKQAKLYFIHYKEVNSKLEEIEGSSLEEYDWYWTLDEYNNEDAYIHRCYCSDFAIHFNKTNYCCVRPVLNLSNK